MENKNKDITFRRIRGRIVPIRKKNEGASNLKKAGAIGISSVLAETAYEAGKGFGKAYKKGKELFRSSMANPQGMRTMSKTGKTLKNAKPVFQDGQASFSFVKDPLNAAQAADKRKGLFKMRLGLLGKALLTTGAALALGEVAASIPTKRPDQEKARKAGTALGFGIATYGFARGVVSPRAATRYTKRIMKGFKGLNFSALKNIGKIL